MKRSKFRLREVLPAIQILLSISALCLLWAIGGVATDFDLQTPTCPEGINSIYMPEDLARQCWEESMRLYLPAWIIPVARATFVGSILCIVIGIILWISDRLGFTGIRIAGILQFQLAAALLVAFLHLFVFPWGWRELFLFTLFGLSGV